MAFIAVPHGALALIQFSQYGQDFSNSFWFVKDGYSSGDLTTLADDLDAFFTTNYKSYFSNEVNYLGVSVYDMRTDGGQVVFNNDGAGLCTLAGTPSPVGLACVVTRYSATRGKSGRGRVYVSGLPEAQLEDGIWLQAAADAALNYVSNMKNTPLTKGWTEVIASRHHNGAPRAEAVTYPVTSRQVRSLIPGTQRRRFDRP